MKRIDLPDPCVVMLIGASGSGKSTFAQQHFPASTVLSSDAFRAMVIDDENSLTVNEDAFDALHYVLRKRLTHMRLTVVDATHIQPESRAGLVRVARDNHLFVVAIVMDTALDVCLERNRERADRTLPDPVIRRHVQQVRRASPKRLRREGIRFAHHVRPDDVCEVVRSPLYANRKSEEGPFDIIGDVHGCFDELAVLIDALGYGRDGERVTSAPNGRRLFFVGDLVDRGPFTPKVLRLVMDAVDDGFALCVPGNHDTKLSKALKGAKVTARHGLQQSLDQLAECDGAFRARVVAFIDGLVSHLVVDGGRLVVAHAGMKQEYQGRSSGHVRAFALYGETTGESDEFGLPVRLNWAKDYRGEAAVVYGHTPTPHAEWLNDTICIDTGCVFGGRLSALRWPEREIVSVPAARVYAEPVKPLQTGDGRTAQQAADDVLDLADVLGKRRVQTRADGAVTVAAENNAAALEIMSRFAVDPRWMPYLPPTMSPCETSQADGWLERPEEAFSYFEKHGVTEVVCQEKHMGSRAVLVLARDGEAALERFGVADGRTGVVYTRTGRPFFGADAETELALLNRVRGAMDECGTWDSLQADWVCFDAELMPWSAKAQQLLQSQYGAVGSAADAGMTAVIDALAAAAERGVDLDGALERATEGAANAAAFRDAYWAYCWDVDSIEDFRLAPFHVLAAGNEAWFHQPHRRHLEVIDALCDVDTILHRTQRRFVELADPGQRAAAVEWWEELTASGGEGMVVKPASFTVRGTKGLVQPGVKVRGREYLRIIYGPDYTQPANLERLRRRGLGRKRSLARREYALGVEGLERFVEREALRRVHECVFGVLALESEPVDPRL